MKPSANATIMDKPPVSHVPVLLNEVIEGLAIQPDGIYIDGTFGRGGHSREILARLSDKGRLIGFDQDPEAVATGEALQAQDSRFQIIYAPFADMELHIKRLGLTGKITGVLLDLGVSSPQLDTAERGFSFMKDGPLDMRMNPDAGESVATWLAHVKASELARVLKTYGEERFAKRIAGEVIKARNENPITRTHQLAEIVKAAHPRWEIGKHPATKSFQALRIFINKELEQIETVLPQLLEVLAPQGRFAIISFHSLEDRLIKRFIRDGARGDQFPKGVPVTVDQLNQRLRKIGKAIFPSAEEIGANPRARSSVLRIAERC